MAKNYYETLGLDKSASKDDIKKAFRKLAHQFHPDKKGGDSGKFKEVNEAYSVLSDDKKRAEYDTYGRTFNGAGSGPYGGGPGAGGWNGSGFNQSGFGGAGFNPQDFGFDFSNAEGFGQGQNGEGFQEFDLGDIFGSFFGGGRGSRTQAKRGSDISIDTELNFQEAVFGTNRKVILAKTALCDACNGSGAEPGTEVKTCSTCNGKGKIHETRNSLLGAFSTTRVCGTCGGSGKIPTQKCKKCRGAGVIRKQEEISIRVPAGINDGEMIRLTGGGEAVAGGATGDLYVKIHVKKHPLFRKEGHNLVTDLSIKLSTALLGGEYALETLDGPLTIKIPSGIKFGEILRVKGRGVPMDGNTTGGFDGQNGRQNGRRGDILIKINIQLPGKISKTSAKLIEELKKEGI